MLSQTQRVASSYRASSQRRISIKAMALSQQDQLKQQAAWKAVEYVKSGMVVGLGTGSTAAFAVGASAAQTLLFQGACSNALPLLPS
jgi:ribose 5-phosphate isomerase A